MRHCSNRHGALLAALILSLAMTVLPPGCAALASSSSSNNNKECALKIPESLQVPPGFANKDSWQEGPMIPLELSLGQVTPQPELSVSTMIQQQLQNNDNKATAAGAIVFAVRRVG